MSGPEKLGAYIKERGLTNKDAAASLGVSTSMLHYWLHGASLPREANRKLIAKWSRGAVPAKAWEAERAREAG